MANLMISHYVLKTKVLGPHERSALWVSGCCFDCAGCIAKEMNNQKATEVDSHILAEIFAKEETEGITISGGEPFLQAKSLTELVCEIREERDYGVIVYTGFEYNDLLKSGNPDFMNFIAEIDILIDGKYEKDKDDGKPYRGSSNQMIRLLSERYKDKYDSYYMSENKRNIEINVEPDHIYMIGVPSEYGLKTWRELKKRAEVNG